MVVMFLKVMLMQAMSVVVMMTRRRGEGGKTNRLCDENKIKGQDSRLTRWRDQQQSQVEI